MVKKVKKNQKKNIKIPKKNKSVENIVEKNILWKMEVKLVILYFTNSWERVTAILNFSYWEFGLCLGWNKN